MVAVTGGFGGGQVGVGASVSTKVFSNDVRAFIGPYSTVNAKGQSAGLNGVYQGSMDENGAISTVDDFHGVIVQATNQEKMIGVTVSGSFGLYFGLGGAVSVEVFDSNARAYIGEHAQINPDRTNVDSRQAVHVVAFNNTNIFVFAGGVAAGLVGVGAAIDVGVIRNDAIALLVNMPLCMQE